MLQRAGAHRAVPQDHEAFYNSKLNDDGRAVRDFISLAFTEPSAANNQLTAAIAEFHLRGDEFSGLRYPAVSKAANVDNLALHPEFVRQSLKLTAAQLVKVDEVGSDGSVGGVVVADLADADIDGKLRWVFRDVGVPVPPGGTHTLREAGRVQVQSSGKILVGGRSYLVEPGYSIEATSAGEAIVRDLRGEVVAPL